MQPSASIPSGSGSYSVAPLPLDRVAQAYPLVQSSLIGTSLKEWLVFATGLILDGTEEAPSGILAAEQKKGFIAGLCTFRGRSCLAHGRVLDVDHFIVLGIFDEARIAEALAQGIEDTARSLGCAAVHTLLPPRDNGYPLAALQRLGHIAESRLYCKTFPGAAT